MDDLPVVTSAEEMLICLGFDATCRLVMFVEPLDEEDYIFVEGTDYILNGYYAICEHLPDYDFSSCKLRQIAILAENGEAVAMLKRAYDFDVDEKGEAQPIKYGPWRSHWVLPEYLTAFEEEKAAREKYLRSPDIELCQKNHDILAVAADMVERWLANGVSPEELPDLIRGLIPEPERELPSIFRSQE